jgi:hypothetical protein
LEAIGIIVSCSFIMTFVCCEGGLALVFRSYPWLSALGLLLILVGQAAFLTLVGTFIYSLWLPVSGR